LPPLDPNGSHDVKVVVDPGHHHHLALEYRVKFEMAEFKGGRVGDDIELEFRRPFKLSVRPLDATLQALAVVEGKHTPPVVGNYGKLLLETSIRNALNCPLRIERIESNLEICQRDCRAELGEGEQFAVIGRVQKGGKQAARIVYSLGDFEPYEFEALLCEVNLPEPSVAASMTAPPVVVWQKPFEAVLTIENLTTRVLNLFFDLSGRRGFLSEGPIRMKLSLVAKQSLRYVYKFVAMYTSSTMLPQIQITDLAVGGEPMVLLVPIVVAHQEASSEQG
jgi:hypothetical protein